MSGDYWFKIVIIDRKTGAVFHEEQYKEDDKMLFPTLAQASFMAGCALTGFMEDFGHEGYLAQIHVYQFSVKVIEFKWEV